MLLPLLLSLAASAGDTLSFQARVLGHARALGHFCVIVNDPWAYSREVLRDQWDVRCRLALPADLEHPRFTCGAAAPPRPDLPLFDPLAAGGYWPPSFPAATRQRESPPIPENPKHEPTPLAARHTP